MAQQTAVEWLEEQLTIETNFYAIYELIAQAKQMEREQHRETFSAGYDYRSSKEKNIIEVFGVNSEPTFEQYYTQTYTTRLQNETN